MMGSRLETLIREMPGQFPPRYRILSAPTMAETSLMKMPGQFPKYLIITEGEYPIIKGGVLFPIFSVQKNSKFSFLQMEGIIPESFILQYINASKKRMNDRSTVKRSLSNGQNILNKKFSILKGELKKKFIDVKNLDHILDSVLDEIKLDNNLHEKFINLNKKQSLEALGGLISLKVLQETFKELNETDKLNFRREALRETRFD